MCIETQTCHIAKLLVVVTNRGMTPVSVSVSVFFISHLSDLVITKYLPVNIVDYARAVPLYGFALLNEPDI